MPRCGGRKRTDFIRLSSLMTKMKCGPEIVADLGGDGVLVAGTDPATLSRRDYPTVKVAFVTGYNEFDYAREAIRLRVHSYLTKPLTEDAIKDFLSQLKREANGEYRSDGDEADRPVQYGVNLERGGYVTLAISIQRNPEHWNVIEFEKLRMSVRTIVRRTFAQEELEPVDLCLTRIFCASFPSERGRRRYTFAAPALRLPGERRACRLWRRQPP